MLRDPRDRGDRCTERRQGRRASRLIANRLRFRLQCYWQKPARPTSDPRDRCPFLHARLKRGSCPITRAPAHSRAQTGDEASPMCLADSRRRRPIRRVRASSVHCRWQSERRSPVSRLNERPSTAISRRTGATLGESVRYRRCPGQKQSRGLHCTYRHLLNF